jgi:hydrogenase-4 component F
VLFAGTLMLTQRDLKRLLAYSTIEHAGIVALALGFGGSLGSFAALLHAIGHAFVKPAAFFAAGLIQREYGTTKLAEVHGVLRKGTCGWYMLTALAALAGMPPFTLFVSEMLVVFAGIAAHAWLALGLGMFGMLLACIAMARIGLEMLAGTPRTPHTSHEAVRVSVLEIAASSFALTCGLLFTLVPWCMRHLP